MSDSPKYEQIPLIDLPEKERGIHFIPTRCGHRITGKQKAFIIHYLQTHELYESAVAAGYSEKYAGTMANRLMQLPHILEIISAEEEKALKRAGIEASRVLKELARIAYFDPRRLYREDNTLKSPQEWDEETAAAISSIESFEEITGKGREKLLIGYTKKVKWWDKIRALENFMTYFGLLVQKKDVTISGDLDLSKLTEEELNRQAEELQRLIAKVNNLGQA